MSAPDLQVYVTGSGTVSGDGLNTFVSGCDTLSQLRAFVGIEGVQVYARGQNAIADGGQGNFYWSLNVVSPDDNLNVIIPPGAGGGGWLRLTGATETPVSGPVPAVSTINDVVTWGNATGSLLKDSGVLLSSLATVAALAKAIQNITSQTFTAPGAFTYTPTNGMLFCLIVCTGAGGGGAGSPGASASAASGGGGGAGATSITIATAAQIGSGQTGAIGAGGAGGVSGNNAGTAGGISSLGTLCVAPGGGGAPAQNGSGQPGGGGAQGTAAISTVGADGTWGLHGSIDTVATIAGNGGGSFWGGGGEGGAAFGGVGDAVPCNVFGGGGGGGAVNGSASTAAGGNGAGGCCWIVEFCA